MAVIDRVRNHGAPSAHEARFVRNGKAMVQVFLSDTSAQTLAQLRNLGFEMVVQPKSGTIVVGRIAVEKLRELAELSVVRYVAPQMD